MSESGNTTKRLMVEIPNNIYSFMCKLKNYLFHPVAQPPKGILGLLYKYRLELILFWLVFVGNLIYILLLPSPYGMDEHGVLSVAAYLSGKFDWSSAYSTSLPYYWGYGQAFFYVPIFWLFDDVYIIYRLCLVVNAIFVSLIPVIAMRIAMRIFVKPKLSVCFAASLIAGFYPFNWVISKWTDNDVLLIVLLWFVAFLLVRLCTFEHSHPAKTALTYVLLGVIGPYAYAVHGRGLVILLSSLLVLFFISLRYKHKLMFLFLYMPVFVLCYKLEVIGKNYILDNLIMTQADEAGNTLQNILKYINPSNFDFHNLLSLIRGALGQFYYVLTSSFGLMMIFFVLSIYLLLIARKVTEETGFTEGYKVLLWFSCISFIAAFGMSVLFFANIYITGGANSREYYFYGRYLETTYPLGIFLLVLFLLSAWTSLKRKKRIFKVSLGLLVVFLVAAIALTAPLFIARNEQAMGFGSLTTILGFAGKAFGTQDVSMYNFIKLTVITLVVFISLIWLVSRRHFAMFTAFLVLLQVYSFNYSIQNWFVPAAKERYSNSMSTREAFEDIYDLSEKYNNIYLLHTGTRPIFLQFVLPDFNITYLSTEVDGYSNIDMIAENSFIMSSEQEGLDILLDNCVLVNLSGVTVWAYGEELIADIEARDLVVDSFKTQHNFYTTYSLYYVTPEILGIEVPEDEDPDIYNRRMQLSLIDKNGSSLVIYENAFTFGPYMTMIPGTYTVTIIGQNLDNVSVTLTYNSGRFKIPVEDYTEWTSTSITFTVNNPNSILRNVEFFIQADSELDEPVSLDGISVSVQNESMDINELRQIPFSSLDYAFSDYQNGWRTRYTSECIGVAKNIWIRDGGFAYIRDVSLPEGEYYITAYGTEMQDTYFEIEADSETEYILELVEVTEEACVYRLILKQSFKSIQLQIHNAGEGTAYYEGTLIEANVFDSISITE